MAVFVNERLYAACVFFVKQVKDEEGPYYRQGRKPRVESSLPTLVARDVAVWLQDVYDRVGSIASIEYVGEIPQVRLKREGKKVYIVNRVDPEDLMFVQSTNAAVGVASGATRVRYVYPEEHKGTVNPEVYWSRVIRRCEVNEAERVVMDALLHSNKNKSGLPCDKVGHGIDAVGIGLWACFR